MADNFGPLYLEKKPPTVIAWRIHEYIQVQDLKNLLSELSRLTKDPWQAHIINDIDGDTISVGPRGFRFVNQELDAPVDVMWGEYLVVDENLEVHSWDYEDISQWRSINY